MGGENARGWGWRGERGLETQGQQSQGRASRAESWGGCLGKKLAGARQEAGLGKKCVWGGPCVGALGEGQKGTGRFRFGGPSRLVPRWPVSLLYRELLPVPGGRGAREE